MSQSGQFRNRLILVIEDEPRMLDLVRISLEGAGFIVSGATSGGEGLAKLRDEIPDLVILDLNLPDISGFEVLREIRNTVQVPVIMLTVQASDDDRIFGLELGADDYLGKPFNHRELVSRIKAVLRRAEMPAPVTRGMVKVDDNLSVDLDKREAVVAGKTVHLRPTEFKLLHYLMRNAERVHSRGQLLDKVWGDHVYIEERTVDVHVKRLREALGDAATMVETVRGAGYRLTAQPDASKSIASGA